jgi:putative tryptophan/tyrosine transport system substrate-binding protein
MIHRRALLGGLLGSALAGVMAPTTACAQRLPATRRIGYLQTDAGTPGGFYDVLRDGLRELGYLEGRNLIIERRSGDPARLPDLAAELVRLNVEVIVTLGPATAAARRASETIPIVFSYSGDPVQAGFTSSLGRPDGNMTGITWLAFDLVGKRLELLKEAAPKVSRVAVLANPAHPGEQRELAETEQTARAVGATVQYHQIRTVTDFPVAFEAIVRSNANALLVFPDGITMAQRRQTAEFAVKHRLPSVFGWREYVEAGGLMAYGPNRLETAKQLSGYADRVLRGAKPADLPVEQPTKFELVINLRTAKALGLTIAPSLLLRADQVIE